MQWEYYRNIKEKADFSLEEDTLNCLLVLSLGRWDHRVIFSISIYIYIFFFNKALVLKRYSMFKKEISGSHFNYQFFKAVLPN